MKHRKMFSVYIGAWICVMATLVIITSGLASADDLPEIKERGVLRHLGVPYANFVTGTGDGLDVELVKLFTQNLGIKYAVSYTHLTLPTN